MAYSTNMLLESLQYSDVSSFLRARDNREAIASYILDEGEQLSFFDKFPGLVYKEFRLDEMVGDLIKLRFYNVTRGVGLAGPYKPTRQLTGSESMSRSAYREETMSFGVHRYAVAIENIVDKKILPAQLVSHVFGMIATWWAEQDDMDTFTTLFRDYPHFVSEVQNLTSTEITERVYPLFGRGTYNNVNALPQYIYAGDGTKGDIEPGATVTGFKSIANGDKKGLATTDTLTDTFIQALGDHLEQQLATMPISMDGGAPFYGMILDTADVKNIFKNSSSTLIANIKAMVRNSDGGSDIFNKNPIFQRQLEHLYNIRMFKWGPIAPLFGSSGDIAENKKDGTPQKGQLSTSIKKGLRGTAITPQAKVLAAAKGAEAVTGLSTWAGGDIKTSVWTQRGVGSTATNYFLFLSCGATHFPYFDGGAVYGADSYNHVDAGYINVTSAALGAGGADGATYGAAPDGSGYYGRAQIGSGATATTQWKIVYKGPLYVGTIQVGNNNEQFTFADDAYMLQIIGLHRWNAGTSAFDAANTRDADWATFKAFLGINASTKVIDQAAAFQTRTFQYNRRVHMFDTVRTLVYGKDLIYKVVGGGAEYNEETRDYGAITGRALTVVQGKKVVVDAQGLISNYIVVCFKRPMVTL